jgi:hypothetical protein
LSLAAIVLVLINLAVIVVSRSGQKLPSGFRPLNNAFLIFGVFHNYETNNEELTIWGLATNRETKLTYWKQLPTEEYFPFTRGERNSRLWANMQYHNLDRRGHWETWQAVGRKILARHNARYLQDPIGQVAFQSLTWPRSPEGFYARQSYESSRKQYWVVAENQ